MMKESPISPLHRKLGALMSPENGWQMPRQFHSLIEEHLATRSACAVFDISSLAKIRVAGNGALEWLEAMLSNSISSCQDGHAVKTLMLNEHGLIIDKLTLLRESAGRFCLLGHAAMAAEDVAWLGRHKPDGGIVCEDETENWSGMALCGPDSERVFARVLPDIELPQPMGFRRAFYRDDDLLITRIGLQGSDGFELFCPAFRGISWFESFISAGAVPCGTTTHEHMRISAAQACSVRDTRGKTPHEAALSSLCSLDKNYIGSEVVAKEDQNPSQRTLVTLRCTEEGDLPATGTPVLDEDGNEVGKITTGCMAPHLGRGMAFAYILRRCARAGTKLRLQLRDASTPVIVSDVSVC